MLKPDAVLRDERVRMAEISDVFSGGQLLTAAIILYCTMAWLRAAEHGRAHVSMRECCSWITQLAGLQRATCLSCK